MDNNKKLAIGSMLSVIGAFGIILVPLLGVSQLQRPWGFILGFLFGLSAGLGVALAIHALIQRRPN